MSSHAKRIILLFISLCIMLIASDVYGDSEFNEIYDDEGGLRINSYHNESINASLHMEEEPPYFARKSYSLGSVGKERKIIFQKHEKGWLIDKIPMGSTFIVPEGYRIRCYAMHTSAISGGKGNITGNNIVYGSGLIVTYTFPSMLYIYKI